jgi:hypothetical protein
MEQSNTNTTEIKIPKKRGRKPTGKIFQIEKGNVKNINTDNDCIIAYLPLSMNDTKDIIDTVNSADDNTIKVDSQEKINQKANISIINDLKNIISHTSECSDEFEKSKILSHKSINKKNEDDIVFKLKSKIDELEKIISNKIYDNIKFDRINEICIDMTKGNIQDINCWWCCYNFDHYPIGLPDNYKEETFHTFGYFCSFNCAKAYNLEKFDNKYEEKNCLLLMLKKKLINDDSFIKIANPRESLKQFGGHQTIEEFRKDFQMIDKTAILIFPPSKPLKLYVEEEYKNKVLRFQNDYKVKRSKPLLRTANNLNNLLKIKE